MILNVFVYDKFHVGFIKKINELYNDQLFFIYDPLNNKTEEENRFTNTKYSSDYSSTALWIKELKIAINECQRVVFHSLFGLRILYTAVKLLSRNKDKYFWVIWGADLYNAYWNRKSSIVNIYREHLRRRFIKNVDSVGIIKGDYLFLKEHYDTRASFYIGSYYYDFEIPVQTDIKNDKTIILLGNSASRSCRYEDIIRKLAKLSNNKFLVYCVLSYPNDKKYIDSVIKIGEKMLGEKFVPITHFMDYDEYMTFLGQVDIAVFNHNRQQAVGNIASLLYLGKSVFISDDNSCKDFFLEMGVKLFPVESLSEKWIENPRLDYVTMQSNKASIESFFGEEQFKKHWDDIFYKKSGGQYDLL